MKYLIPRGLATTALIAIPICLGLTTFLEAGETETTYEAVIKGKQCKDYKNPQRIECNYRVGQDLRFDIAGVGQGDAGVTFTKADEDGDYYATFGIMHGCVVVKPGKKNSQRLLDPDSMAFVSPKNGKVYKTWAECSLTRGE